MYCTPTIVTNIPKKDVEQLECSCSTLYNQFKNCLVAATKAKCIQILWPSNFTIRYISNTLIHSTLWFYLCKIQKQAKWICCIKSQDSHYLWKEVVTWVKIKLRMTLTLWYFLIWVLVIQVCSICDDSLNCSLNGLWIFLLAWLYHN